MWENDEAKENAYNQLIENVKKEAAKQEHNSVELRRLAAEFRNLFEGYKDAEAIAGECERVARNQELKDRDRTLTERMRNAVDEEDFKALAEEFRAMGAYPNASAKAGECERRYQKLADERSSMDTKIEEQYYYTEYTAAAAEMQRLSQRKTFRPNDFRRLGDEWRKLSEQYSSIGKYRDSQTLADECSQKAIESYEKSELAKKLWMVSKIAVALIAVAVVIILVISLVNLLRGPGEETQPDPGEVMETPEPTPEPPQQWNEAYSEYLQGNNNTLSAGGSDAVTKWGTSDIRFAELVDFDNNGTPELVLILDILAIRPENSEHSRYNIKIFSYTDQMVPLYDEYITSQGAKSEDYAIATNSSGQSYLVSRISDNDGSFSKEYLTLSNGQWTPALSVEFIPGYVDYESNGQDAPPADDGDEEDELILDDNELVIVNDEFLVNGEQASETEFNTAESELLGIARTRILGVDTENTVQTLIASLRDTYLYGNIPNNSSLREPMHVQLGNAIEQGNEAIRISVRWNSYGITTFIRAADSEDWTTVSRNGGTGDVLPAFELDDEALTIGFPTTDRMYFLQSDFTGRFSKPDGSNSEGFTWTFVIG